MKCRQTPWTLRALNHSRNGARRTVTRDFWTARRPAVARCRRRLDGGYRPTILVLDMLSSKPSPASGDQHDTGSARRPHFPEPAGPAPPASQRCSRLGRFSYEQDATRTHEPDEPPAGRNAPTRSRRHVRTTPPPRRARPAPGPSPSAGRKNPQTSHPTRTSEPESCSGFLMNELPHGTPEPSPPTSPPRPSSHPHHSGEACMPEPATLHCELRFLPAHGILSGSCPGVAPPPPSGGLPQDPCHPVNAARSGLSAPPAGPAPASPPTLTVAARADPSAGRHIPTPDCPARWLPLGSTQSQGARRRRCASGEQAPCRHPRPWGLRPCQPCRDVPRRPAALPA